MLRSSPSTHKIPFGVWSTLNSTELPETPEQIEVRKKLGAEHTEKIASLKADQSKLTEEKKAIIEQLAKLEKKTKVADTQSVPATIEQLIKQRDELTEKLKTLGTEIQHAEFFSCKVPKAFAMRDAEKPADMPIYIRGNPYAPMVPGIWSSIKLHGNALSTCTHN